MSSETSLTETLTATEYNELTGPITINLTEALLRIAAAIARLAASSEKMVEVHSQNALQAAHHAELVRQTMMMHMQQRDDGPGHA